MLSILARIWGKCIEERDLILITRLKVNNAGGKRKRREMMSDKIFIRKKERTKDFLNVIRSHLSKNTIN